MIKMEERHKGCCEHCHSHAHTTAHCKTAEHTAENGCCAHDHAAHHHTDTDSGGEDSGDACGCCTGAHHEHDHDHGHACGCAEEHGQACACGHTHAAEEAPKWLLPVAIALFALGLLFEHVLDLPAWAQGATFGAAALLAGYSVLLDGLRNLLRLKFTENVLMSIAVVASFCMGEFGEAAAVAILFSIGELAEEIAEKNSRRSITALTEIRPDTARVLRGAIETVVEPGAVRVGEIISVYPYERIPLDGEVVSGTSYLDNAALTGESVPVEVSQGDPVLSGGINGSAALKIRVTSAFEDSTASRILKLIEESAARKGSAEKLITRFAKVYTPIVLVLAILVAVLPPLLGLGAFAVWFRRALIMLVASCPCALVISVPLGFFAGIGVESKIGMLVKGGKYLEALAKTETVALDKTGTVTTGKLSVAGIYPMEGVTEQALLQKAAAVESLSAHPVAYAIVAAAGGEVPQAAQIEELAGRGIRAVLDGKTILAGRKTFLAENGIDTSRLPDCTVAIAEDGKAIGALTLADTVKPDSKAAVQALRKAGVKHVVMMTGDNEATAKAVAGQVDITEYRAGLLPQDKASAVESMTGVRVFVGDGVNDAPVLAAADCGVAVGFGAQAAIETADAVLSGGNLSALPRAIRLARRAMRVIHANIIFALAVKAAVLLCTPFGLVPMWLGVFADVGVTILTVLNTLRILRFKV